MSCVSDSYSVCSHVFFHLAIPTPRNAPLISPLSSSTNSNDTETKFKVPVSKLVDLPVSKYIT